MQWQASRQEPGRELSRVGCHLPGRTEAQLALCVGLRRACRGQMGWRLGMVCSVSGHAAHPHAAFLSLWDHPTSPGQGRGMCVGSTASVLGGSLPGLDEARAIPVCTANGRPGLSLEHRGLGGQG